MALEKSNFGLRVRAIRWEEKEKKKKRRRRRKKEEGRREEKNLGLEHLLCLEIDIGWFGALLRLGAPVSSVLVPLFR